MQRQILPTLVVALALAGVATPVFAQDTNVVPPDTGAAAAAPDFDGDSITIGGGFAYLPDYEGSNDYRFTPAPGAIGSVHGYSFTLAGNRASVDLIRNQPGPSWDVQAGPIAVVNFNRNSLNNIDDRRVRALGKVDTAIELGGYVGIGKTGVITSPYDKLSVTVSYRHDVNGAHDSGILQPTINYLTPLSRKMAVGLFASAEHVERGYGQAYFGVDAAQSVASGLPVYDAPRGWKNWTLGALGTYALTGDLLHGFKIVGGGTYGREFDRFAESPVVRIAGKRSQWLGVLGVAYTF